MHTVPGYVLRGVCTSLILASLLLFVFTNKHNYDRVDICITYALLSGAAGLDIVALTMLLVSDLAVISITTRLIQLGKKDENSIVSRFLEKIQSSKNPKWSESMSQYNLIDFCLNKRPAYVNLTVRILGVPDVLDHFLCTSYELVDTSLKHFIFTELKRKSKSANDSKSIKMLCSCRGSWVLEDRGYQNQLGWSVDSEFDESLLLWHIATDICYNYKSEVNGEGANHANTAQPDYRKMSRHISDYMLYLLVVQPSMMSSMAGIGLIRYRDTCAEAKIFFPRQKSKDKLIKARRMLREVDIGVDPKYVKGDRSKSVLFDAVKLAKQLDELPNKWMIIGEVWVELLSYSASHCRGNAHAARLSKGGELLMFVWFLMVHLGLGEQFCIEAGHASAKLIVDK
ncbi:hypothetical protein IFM89_004721 [Coptis chinensis]|uniref:DUF4220 domain-containing protein n=1 Tax=Coptis chinensis TaxID=261450 RepID=A0A835GUS6_9MAGN|nr:hypothetical protein IFM89_004721 [Coptis chinensis]